MSVLLVRVGENLAAACIERLNAQGDEVRIVVEDGSAEKWRAMGAFVALGPVDADLIERASQNVRTLVMGAKAEPLIDEIVEGARHAEVERLVLCAPAPGPPAVAALKGWGNEFVILRAGGRMLRRTPSPTRLAAAIDAADDLAGPLALELDLGEPGAWKVLKVGA